MTILNQRCSLQFWPCHWQLAALCEVALMDVVAPGWVNGGANTWMVDQGNVASPLTCFFWLPWCPWIMIPKYHKPRGEKKVGSQTKMMQQQLPFCDPDLRWGKYIGCLIYLQLTFKCLSHAKTIQEFSSSFAHDGLVMFSHNVHSPCWPVKSSYAPPQAVPGLHSTLAHGSPR